MSPRTITGAIVGKTTIPAIMTDALAAALFKIKEMNGEINSDIIKDLIKANEERRTAEITAYAEYKGDVPILGREDKSQDGICNKLPHDFRGEIVDTFTGYIYGNPIVYETDSGGDENENKAADDKQDEYIMEFNKVNNIEDLDSETGKFQSICGRACRLLYQGKDESGVSERVMSIPPWECIFIKDMSTKDNQAAMRYYKVAVVQNGTASERYRVEWYDNTHVTFWIEVADGTFMTDDTETINPLPHNFKLIPLLEYINNNEKQGDFEKTKALIDAYDKCISFNQDEFEAFRNAYLKVTGTSLDKEQAEEIANSRVMSLPKGGEAAYLTKDIKDAFLEHHLARLEDNIYRFARIPNLNDEKFSGGAQSGESRKYKLMGLENKSITKERKFTAATRHMFEVLNTLTSIKGQKLDWLNITIQFTRNLPIELSLYADVAAALKGTISMRTILSLMPFIDDVEAEMARIEEEAPADPFENMNVNQENINQENNTNQNT